jgi:hypothetical protein
MLFSISCFSYVATFLVLDLFLILRGLFAYSGLWRGVLMSFAILVVTVLHFLSVEIGVCVVFLIA